MIAIRPQVAIYAGRVAEVLAQLEAAGGVSQRRYLMDLLRDVVAQADPGSVDETTLRRLEAAGFGKAELVPLSSEVPVAAVHVPLVTVGERCSDGGGGTRGEAGTGFCRLMIASYDPAGMRVQRECYDAAARAAVVDGFHAAAQVLGHVPLEGFAFLPYRTGVLSQVAVSGASLGAATAVSAAALRTGRSVRPGTAVTGRITGERVAAVGGLEAKIVSLVGRHDIRGLIVAGEDRVVAEALVAHHGSTLDVIGVVHVAELLEAALEPEVRIERDPERAVAEVHAAYGRGWQGWQWPGLLERLGRVTLHLPPQRPDLQVRVLTMLASVQRNLGDPNAALEVLEEALAVLGSDAAELAVPDDVRSFLYRHLAVTLRLLCRFDEALEAAHAAEACARRGRLRGDLAFALGTRGLVHVSRNELTHALDCQLQALEHLLEHDPSHAPRTAANAIEVLGLAGRVEEARARYRQAMAWVTEKVTDGDRRRTDEQWLRVRLAGALRDPRDAAEVRDLLEVPCVLEAIAEQPLPGLLARRWLGLATIDLAAGDGDQRRKGYAQLAQSATAHPKVREPHVRFMAQLNVLYETSARAAHDELDADAVQRARLALTHLPQSPEAAALLSPVAAPVLAALAAWPATTDVASAGTAEALGPALAALLRSCWSLA